MSQEISIDNAEGFHSEAVLNAREKSKRNVVEKTAENAAYSLQMEATATIPSMMNDISKLHDCTTYFQNDIRAYQSKKFYELLKQLDTDHQVQFVNEESLTFTSGSKFEFSHLPDELYQRVQAELQKLPVYTVLGQLAQVIGSSCGEPVSMAIPSLSDEDEYIILRTLGLTRESIDVLRTTREQTDLQHSPGFSISPQADNSLVIEYSPEPVALAALEKTLLWSRTGEEIMDGLGKAHLSDNLKNILSEGHINGDGSHRFNNRYGNGYADGTRLLSQCIGRDQRAVYNLIWDDPDHEVDEETSEKWLSLSHGSDSPSARFFTLLYDVSVTQFNPELHKATADRSTYPHFKFSKITSYNDGSCKDAETYYCGASSEKLVQPSPYFLEKQSYGSSTALVLSPIMVNAVLIQPGHLVKLLKAADGTITDVQPLRFTMFMFNEEEASDAYGWQHAATKENLTMQHITPLDSLNRRVL